MFPLDLEQLKVVYVCLCINMLIVPWPFMRTVFAHFQTICPSCSSVKPRTMCWSLSQLERISLHHMTVALNSITYCYNILHNRNTMNKLWLWPSLPLKTALHRVNGGRNFTLFWHSKSLLQFNDLFWRPAIEATDTVPPAGLAQNLSSQLIWWRTASFQKIKWRVFNFNVVYKNYFSF